jgi:hypothetical protein
MALRSGSHVTKVIVVGVIFIVCLLAFTVPAELKHAGAINKYCAIPNCNLYGLAAPSYNSFLVVSTTTVTSGSNKELCSIGLLSKVFVVKDFSILRTPQEL